MKKPFEHERHPVRVLAVVLAALWVWPAVGWSHAHPEQRRPVSGAVLKQAPAAVSIRFSEELEPAFSYIKISSKGAQPADAVHSHIDAHDPRRLVLPVESLKPGAYVVHWRAVARDGHATEGRYSFRIAPSGD